MRLVLLDDDQATTYKFAVLVLPGGEWFWSSDF